MVWYPLSALLAASFVICVGVFVYLKNPKHRLNQYFFMMNTSIALWNLADFILLIKVWDINPLLVVRVSYVGAFFIAPFFSKLIFIITEADKQIHYRNFYKSSLLGAVILCVLDITPLFLKDVRVSPFYEYVGPLYVLFEIFFISIVLYSLYHLFVFYLKTKSPLRKTQIKYIFMGLVIGVLATVVYFISLRKTNMPSIHFFIEIIYISIFTYAIFKYHIMDIRIAITRGVIFTVVYGIALIVPIIIAVYNAQYFERLFGEKWWVGFFIIGAITSYIGQLIYNYVLNKAENKLLYKQRKYQKSLLRASKDMLFIRDMSKIQKEVVDILVKEIKISHVKFFIYDADKKEYKIKAFRGEERRAQTGQILGESHPLIKLLYHEKRAVLGENLTRMDYSPKLDLNIDMITKEVRALGAILIIPILSQKRVQGFISLGNKRHGGIYTVDDIAVMTTLLNQVALAMENAEFYEKIKEQEATLLQTFKLTTLGEMAAGFAHQINNPLTGIIMTAGAARLSTEKKLIKIKDEIGSSAEKIVIDANETFKNIEERAENVGNIVKNIMRFSKPSEFQKVEIHKIIAAGLGMIPKSKFADMDIKIVKNIDDNLPLINVCPVDMEQVVMNLSSNAIEAMPDGGMLSINASFAEEKDGMLKVEFVDTGVGIGDEYKDKIFDFFFTTKGSKGLGIGLSLVYKMVESNRGDITVDSRPGEGSCFTLYLPIG
jgi:signal transduction histidine kinase